MKKSKKKSVLLIPIPELEKICKDAKGVLNCANEKKCFGYKYCSRCVSDRILHAATKAAKGEK